MGRPLIIGIVLSSNRPYHRANAQHLRAGFEAAGDVAAIGSSAVIYRRRHDFDVIAKHSMHKVRQFGSKPLLITEGGYLDRQLPRISVGWGNMHGRAQLMNQASPPDRWRQLSGETGIQLRPWRSDGKALAILVLGQKPGDASHVPHVRIECWYDRVIRELRNLTNRRIIFREHPHTRDLKRNLGETFVRRHRSLCSRLGVEYSDPAVRALVEDFARAFCAVSFSSTASVEAVVAGIPSIALDVGNMAWPVSSHDLRDVDSPPMPSREQWLYNLCYAQWTLDEIAQGLPWARLRPGFESVKQRLGERLGERLGGSQQVSGSEQVNPDPVPRPRRHGRRRRALRAAPSPARPA